MNPTCSRNKPRPPLLLTGSLKIADTRDKIEPRITTSDKSEVMKFMNNTIESMAPGPKSHTRFPRADGCVCSSRSGISPFQDGFWSLHSPLPSPTLSYCSLLFPWLPDPNVSIGLFPFYHRLHLHVSTTFTGSLHEKTMSPQTSWSYFQCCLRKTNSRTGREKANPETHTAKMDLRIYHSGPKDGRGVLPS